MNIVTPPERVVETLSERTPVSVGKKLGFKPPITDQKVSHIKKQKKNNCQIESLMKI